MSHGPLNPAARHAQTVAELCRYIESAEHSPTLEELAQRAGMSAFHLHRVFKAITGLTPKGYATASGRNACGSELVSGGYGHRSDLWSRLQLRQPLLRAGRQVLGMTPSRFRAGGAQSDIRFAIGQCSLGAILVAQSERGVCAISLGDDPEELARQLQDRFPNANLIGGDAGIRAAGGQRRGHRRGAAPGPRPAARRARHRVPAARVAGAARDTRRARRRAIPRSLTHRRAAIGAGGGASLRREHAGDRDTLPSRRAQRRRLSGYRWGVERKRALLEREAQA